MNDMPETHEDLGEEFRRLGRNLKEALQAAWDSDERRRLEHEMARQAELVSHSYGKEPRRHVRIFRE